MSRTKLKEVVIDRALWLTGKAAEASGVESKLRCSYTHRMCCLGFVARVEGFSAQSITGRHDFEHLADKSPRFAKKLDALNLIPGYSYNEEENEDLDLSRKREELIQYAIDTNDNPDLPDDIREDRIEETLRGLGYEVKFVGKYPKFYKKVR